MQFTTPAFEEDLYPSLIDLDILLLVAFLDIAGNQAGPTDLALPHIVDQNVSHQIMHSCLLSGKHHFKELLKLLLDDLIICEFLIGRSFFLFLPLFELVSRDFDTLYQGHLRW